MEEILKKALKFWNGLSKKSFWQYMPSCIDMKKEQEYLMVQGNAPD